LFDSIFRKLFPANVLFRAVEVFPGLYQGSKISTDEDVEKVKDLKINLIIDLEGGFDPPMNFLDSYLFWPILDLPFLPDLQGLLMVSSFGKWALDYHRRVLVHCRCGFNRSGLVCGRIMALKGCRGPEILRKITEKVPGALWNPIFREYIRGL
jgi:protein-tyrosine phosphatase